MSHVTPRWVLGTARRRLVAVQRRLRWRLRLRPRTAPAVPRPAARRRGEPPLRLARALVACDLNPDYLAFWPLVRRAWTELVEVEPLLVVVAPVDRLPPELAGDPLVRPFEPIEGLHTAFQAQCVRLLYPALLPGDGAVVTSDVDMLPLDGRWFHAAAGRARADQFVAYRDLLLPIGQIPICYNAALPATWAELFGVGDDGDLRALLAAWGEGLAYAGERGGAGWDTDQETLYRTLLGWARRTRRAWILDDDSTGFRRLERAELRKPRALGAIQVERLRHGGYADFHALPQGEFGELNEQVLELARCPR